MVWKFCGYDAVGSKGWVYGDLVHDKKITVTESEARLARLRGRSFMERLFNK